MRAIRSRVSGAVAVVCISALALGACGGGGGGSSSAFCSKAKDLKALDEETDQKKVLEEAKKAASSAPSEIKDDMKTLVDGLEKLIDGDFSAATDPKFETASDNVEKYAKDKCGIDLGGSDG